MTRVAIRVINCFGYIEWRFGTIVLDDTDTGVLHVNEVLQTHVNLGLSERVEVRPLWKSPLYHGFQRYQSDSSSVMVYAYDEARAYVNQFCVP